MCVWGVGRLLMHFSKFLQETTLAYLFVARRLCITNIGQAAESVPRMRSAKR